MGPNELRIKMTLDDAGVDAKLDKFGAHAKQATGQGFEAMERLRAETQRAGEAMDSARTSASGVGTALTSIVAAQVGLNAVRGVAEAIGGEFRRANEYVEKTAQQFADVRRALQQVAALRGEANSNEFTRGQVEQAAGAGLTPKEWIAFQEEFQSRGGAFLEGDQARLTPAEGDEFQSRVATFAKARGIAASDAAATGAGLLQFSEGKQDVNTLLDRFGKIFKTLERAPTPAPQLMGQMNRIMSQGFSPEEAAQALAIASEGTPGQEKTSVENALKMITAARLKGRGDELGLKKGMTPFQELEAAARTLQGRADKGEDVEEIISDFTHNKQERRGILAAFMTRGVKAKGFERYRKYAADTPADFVAREIEKYRRSDEGRHAAADIEGERAALDDVGYGEQDVKLALKEADNEMIRRHLKDRALIQNLPRHMTQAFTGVDPEKQIRNEIALSTLRRRAATLGITEDSYSKFPSNPEMAGNTGADAMFRGQQSVNDEIKDLLKSIDRELKRQGETNRDGPPPPLIAGGAALYAARVR